MLPLTRELIETLIGFDTTSRDSNLPLIDYVRDYLAALGVESSLSFDDDGRKANLFATLGPADVPGVVLSGHTDVVPVDGQHWSTPPFSLSEREGRLYGRGTCDMKAFIAVVLALVPEMQRRELRAPLHLAFSYDEEVGCIGVHRLLEQVAKMPVRPRACIVGEPTAMQVVNAHKGKASLRCCVRGKAAHSSLTHQGVNAVEYAAEVIAYLRQMGRRLREGGPHDQTFEPPFTTVHTGLVSGGTALNIIPQDCAFEFEIRNLPQQDPAELVEEIKAFARDRLQPEMRAVAEHCGIDWEPLPSYPALASSEDAEVVRLAKRAARANRVGSVSFGTEAGVYQRHGVAAVVCGPGNIAQAHKPDEYVEVSQVDACEVFLRRLLDDVAD